MQYARSLRQLAKVPAKIAKPVAKRLKKDQERYFNLGVDPYGRPWAPLKPATLAKGRHPPPLTDTRKGRRGIKFTPAKGAGVQIRSFVSYMAGHMRKTANRAARKFLPENRLPRKWQEITQDEYTKAVKRHLA
jgi:hypothetical protein